MWSLGNHPFIMNTSKKQEFIIANKSLLANKKIINAKIKTTTEDSVLDEMIDEIRNNPEFVDATQSEEIITDGVPPTVIIDGCGPCKELTVEKLGPGSVVFNYGNSLLYCNNAKVITAFGEGLLKKGDTVQFKAESITTNNNGRFIGDANVTASPILATMQEAIEVYNTQQLLLINKTMLEESTPGKPCSRKRAEEIIAEQRKEARKNMILPQLSFGK